MTDDFENFCREFREQEYKASREFELEAKEDEIKENVRLIGLSLMKTIENLLKKSPSSIVAYELISIGASLAYSVIGETNYINCFVEDAFKEGKINGLKFFEENKEKI